MLEWLADRVSREWAVIRNAPFAFIFAIIFVVVLVYIALELLHSEKYETQNQRISFLSDQLQTKEKESDQLDNQLKVIWEKLGEISLTENTDYLNNKESNETKLTLDNMEKELNDRFVKIERLINNSDTDHRTELQKAADEIEPPHNPPKEGFTRKVIKIE